MQSSDSYPVILSRAADSISSSARYPFKNFLTWSLIFR